MSVGPLGGYWVYFGDSSLQLTVPGTDGDLVTRKARFVSKKMIFGVIGGGLGWFGNQPPHPPIFGRNKKNGSF